MKPSHCNVTNPTNIAQLPSPTRTLSFMADSNCSLSNCLTGFRVLSNGFWRERGHSFSLAGECSAFTRVSPTVAPYSSPAIPPYRVTLGQAYRLGSGLPPQRCCRRRSTVPKALQAYPDTPDRSSHSSPRGDPPSDRRDEDCHPASRLLQHTRTSCWSTTTPL